MGAEDQQDVAVGERPLKENISEVASQVVTCDVCGTAPSACRVNSLQTAKLPCMHFCDEVLVR